MKICCIGEILIDMICTDVNTPLSQGQHFLKKAGGAPANVAAAIAALGGTVDMAAKTGVDPFGTHLIDTMKNAGVGTDFLFRDKEHFTTLAFVSLMENGERDFYFNRGADAFLNIHDIEHIELKQYSIVHFGSATAFLPGPLQDAYYWLLQKCTRENVLISFDPNYRSLLFQNGNELFIEQSWTFLNSCHFFKVSDEEALLLTGKQNISEAAAYLQERTNAAFAITLGKEGTLLRLNKEMITIESIEVKAIDTTGAGDAFTGAVLYQLRDKNTDDIKKMSMDEWKPIIFNANKAGAKTCEYMGAMEAFSHLSNKIFN